MVKVKKTETVIVDPVSALARDLEADLRKIRDLNPVSITQLDIKKLQFIARKYNIDGNINKSNFYNIKGKLSFIIQDKLEALAYQVLERERELTPSKRPRKPKVEKEKEPEELWKG